MTPTTLPHPERRWVVNYWSHGRVVFSTNLGAPTRFHARIAVRDIPGHRHRVLGGEVDRITVTAQRTHK